MSGNRLKIVVLEILNMATVADMKSTFDNQGRIRMNYAEGETVISLPAMVFIVSDNFINTVCSCCLKVDKSREELRRCVQCGFVRYCSVDCQKRDWKGYHKDECQILKCVWKVCGAQCTDLVRLFVRSRLKINASLKENEPRGVRQVPKSDATQCLTFSHRHDGCKKMFRAWTPLAQALDGHYNACLRQKGVLMKAKNELIGRVMSVYPEKFDSEADFHDDACSVIGYANFDFLSTVAFPSCKRNVVLLPTTKSDAGPLLEIKAVVPLQAGEQLYFANAPNSLGDPTLLESKRICPVVCEYCDVSTQSTLHYHIAERTEMLCAACHGPASLIYASQPSRGYMEFYCKHCRVSTNASDLWGLVLPGAGMQLWKSVQGAGISFQWIKQLAKAVTLQLEESVRSLTPFVVPTSFPLGIYYRELADLYEKDGRMDQCVEAYEMVIPVVEKHLDRYDQNVFDGLARLIVFHLERTETEEALPYIEKAWTRLRHIPGKNSADFYVVDKLRTAVRTNPAFSFKEFCEVAPP